VKGDLMLARRTVVLLGSVAAVAAGSVGAIAATTNDEAKKAEAEVLSDAAKDLGVKSDDLRMALSDALNAQLDKAVKAGKLTQEQADAIKKRRAESGTVLPMGPGLRGPHGHGMRGGPGFGHMREEMAAAAKALGISIAELREQLRTGKTVAEIAKAENKDLADVKAAMKTAALAELDAAVKAGRLTEAQRDEIAKDLDARIDDKVNGRMGPGRRGHHRRGHGPGPGFGPPPAGNQNGSAPAPPPGAGFQPA
jgi:hypothetical protein